MGAGGWGRAAGAQLSASGALTADPESRVGLGGTEIFTFPFRV